MILREFYVLSNINFGICFFWCFLHAQNLKHSQNKKSDVDIVWEVLKFMFLFDNPYSVLASAFQQGPRNIAVDFPIRETVDTFEVTFANVSGSGASGS